MNSSVNGGSGVPSPRNYALSGKIMLSTIVVLFFIVLFILFLHFYVRWNVLRRANRRARRRRRIFIFSGQNQPSSAGRALDPAILKSLPVLLFSVGSDDDDGVDECDCAVCLDEFLDGQKIRTLPRCGHIFHMDCIDMWFSAHSNCPLCRTAVAIPAGDLKSASDLCSCRPHEQIGPSSSVFNDEEVAIQVPASEIDSNRAERLRLGHILRWPINRVAILKQFMMLNHSNRIGSSGMASDLESGEGSSPSTSAV